MALVVFYGRKRNKEKPALFSLYMVCVLSVSFFSYPTKPLDWGAHTTHPDKGKMTNNFGDGRCCPPVLALSLPPPMGRHPPFPFPPSPPLSLFRFLTYSLSPPQTPFTYTPLSLTPLLIYFPFTVFLVCVCVSFF